MKNRIVFGVYLMTLFTYVTITKDIKFLVLVAILFVSVAAVTFGVLLFIHRERAASPEIRERRASDH